MALRESRENGKAFTVEAFEPVAMFGCRVVQTIPVIFGAVWLMSTDELARRPRLVIENSREWLAEVTKGCHYSGNVVDCRNEVSIRWLRWMGYGFPRKRDIGGFPFWEFFKSHV